MARKGPGLGAWRAGAPPGSVYVQPPPRLLMVLASSSVTCTIPPASWGSVGGRLSKSVPKPDRSKGIRVWPVCNLLRVPHRRQPKAEAGLNLEVFVAAILCSLYSPSAGLGSVTISASVSLLLMAMAAGHAARRASFLFVFYLFFFKKVYLF